MFLHIMEEFRNTSQTIDYICKHGFSLRKKEIDFRETFELQDERFLGYHHPESEMDIYISFDK